MFSLVRLSWYFRALVLLGAVASSGVVSAATQPQVITNGLGSLAAILVLLRSLFGG
jgi:hypothetical protein